MYYINSASTISYQNTFGKNCFSENMIPVKHLSALIHPNYKEFIESGMLRRMSEIIKMSICCSLDCIMKSKIKEPDAIIVGTGLGCLHDTDKFFNDIISSENHLISPTPFIQSTHNTIAGQLSLILKNHNYNMTHTQNSLSFEHALQDGLLCLDEGKEYVLVGAADEHIEMLDNISDKLNYKELILTSGASFFILSKKKIENANVKIVATTTYGRIPSITTKIEDFFRKNEIKMNTIDLILYSSIDKNNQNNLNDFFKNKLLCDYQNYCGTYFSNSAFGFHLGVDILNRKKVKFDFMEREQANIKRVLVCNNLNNESLGLTLIESDET